MTLPERLSMLDGIRLQAGKHASLDDGACVMEAVSFVAGEAWSDHPQCASQVISDFVRSWNDTMNDSDRQILVPLIPKLVGTAGTPEHEVQRSWMALDWYCRVNAPAWLRLAGLTAEAEAIEATAPIVDSASATAAQQALDAARSAVYKAQAAARDAARAAAGTAAWDIAGAAAGTAARDAARDAAWAAAGTAARAAAGTAAWDIAGDIAWDAARAAAWDVAGDVAWAAAGDVARAKLRPTIEALQTSAIELMERMIAVTADGAS